MKNNTNNSNNTLFKKIMNKIATNL
jgi:hypothetical protein